ncbi:phosphatidylserine decarboxylase [Bacillus pakistanensis]|uniref:phosphatidylserine decarboxylase n=1 Tax=Rossellomorea pakistanensis TaxID=992288 RepID=A0ABS2NA75_9BACI|nr:phosphatidylserine decarboxylase [Bacillus pakistanensis]MBM7584761.1 phosphatidylserine decarboxylase [Bacillus pakistanensis]
MKKALYQFLIELTNKRWSSILLKKFVQSRLSQKCIPSYMKVYEIDSNEIEHEISYYPSLHEFFTRRLREGVREIQGGEKQFVSPVDGTLAEAGTVTPNLMMQVKGKDYSIQEMLGNEEIAKKYVGGSFLVLYLSPANYHRIHSPIKAAVEKRWELGLHSYPVNEYGLKYGRETLSKNYRSITELKHKGGDMLLVKVGAMFVNSIHYTNDHHHWNKGDEIGYFTFGSTVILFFEKGTFHFNDDLSVPTPIKMGKIIGQMKRG